ncbi:spore protease YyaC [Rossellomorea marisflavi]|uniref:Sporulation protein n=1 Tax=Rossellomorea marisflavi TaxID=189381 RepID=A0A163LQX8_9BACI|nr:spore protease YyaC [Rossellomorea marisflavi]KZE50711.1 sporulation protein [Rossellomorea marisflavi]QHA35463.1 spore protease YyaC [Rossellomorea marisflavi]
MRSFDRSQPDLPVWISAQSREYETETLLQLLQSMLTDLEESGRTPVILCIGSDRYVGDSLGPLVGTMLTRFSIPSPVYGTLETPIHAFNLKPTLKAIQKTHRDPFIMTVDAALGKQDAVGSILFNTGPLTPGKALEKMLPEVGDCHFQGIVNSADPLPSSQFLNDTRLYTVMTLAERISAIIQEAYIRKEAGTL